MSVGTTMKRQVSAPPAPVTKPPRLDALTGVRGIAAWLVVLYHIRASLGDVTTPEVIALLGKGYLAVDLFFVLSGFVIWLNNGERLAQPGWRAVPTFFRNRLARIYPLHLVILTATIAWALVLAATGRADSVRYPWAALPMNLALIHNWGLVAPLSWNIPSWSISTEWAAYLLLPSWAGLAAGRRLTPMVAIVAIVSLAAVLHLLFIARGHDALGSDIEHLGLLRCLAEFAIGAIACRLWQQVAHHQLPTIAAIGCAVGTLAWWAAGETFGAPLTFGAFVVLLATLAPGRGNPLAWRWVVWLGEVSYSTYLAHALLWVVVKVALVDDVAHVAPAIVALYLAVVLVTSAVLFQLVERPGQRLVAARRTPLHG